MKRPLNLTNASNKQLSEIKNSLRKKVPILTIQQIRRIKLPLVKALKIELEEGNHKKASILFQEFLEIDKNHLKCFINGNNSMLLEEIFILLKNFDNKTADEEISILIMIIKRLFIENENFDWLIEFLVIRGNQIISDNNLEGSKIYTILAYLHGLSLSHRLHWYRAALLQFESAFRIALNNNDWTYEDESICIKISQELSDCLVKLSKQIRIDEHNPQNALIYASRALTVLRHQVISKNPKLEIDAEIELGECFLASKIFAEAKEHFEHGLALSEHLELHEKYCDCLVKIAKCYKGLDDNQTYEKILFISKDYAFEKSLSQLLGDIFINLMEFYLEIFDMQKVGETFLQAFDFFMEKNDNNKLLEIELLFAHASSKLHFNQVVDTILKTDKGQVGDNSYLQRLIAWIDQKSSKSLEDDKSEDLSLEDFIKKYYEPNEITKIDRYTI